MKKLILLLSIAIALPTFAQTSKAATAPAKANAAASSVPQISLQDTNQLLKLQLEFGQLSQQMQKLQADGQTLTAQYNTLAGGLCKSSDGKKYAVELGPDPKCKEVPPAPTTAPAKK
jgi:Skp family chaperone for outer membrane proteins